MCFFFFERQERRGEERRICLCQCSVILWLGYLHSVSFFLRFLHIRFFHETFTECLAFCLPFLSGILWHLNATCQMLYYNVWGFSGFLWDFGTIPLVSLEMAWILPFPGLRTCFRLKIVKKKLQFGTSLRAGLFWWPAVVFDAWWWFSIGAGRFEKL